MHAEHTDRPGAERTADLICTPDTPSACASAAPKLQPALRATGGRFPKRPNVTFSASPRRPAGPSAADHAAAPPRLAASPHWRTRRLHCTRITLTEGRSGAGAYVAPRAGDVGVHVGTTRVAAATAGPQSTMAAAWCACRVVLVRARFVGSVGSSRVRLLLLAFPAERRRVVERQPPGKRERGERMISCHALHDLRR